MAVVSHVDELPQMVSVKPGRVRTFIVSPERAGTDAMLCGRMEYLPGGGSPYHYHVGCEHFFYILAGRGKLRLEDRELPLEPGTLVFIPDREKHQLLNPFDGPLQMLEFQIPNRFKTEILEGSAEDLRWKRADGGTWEQK